MLVLGWVTALIFLLNLEVTKIVGIKPIFLVSNPDKCGFIPKIGIIPINKWENSDLY